MKKILTISFLFFATQVFGQKLEGKYHASFIGGETINFINEDSFYFKGSYCNVIYTGKGIYEIADDFLYLYFENSKSNIKSNSFRKPELSPVIIDSNKRQLVSVKCLDTNSNPLPFFNIVVSSKGKLISNLKGDANGQSSFIVKTEEFPLTIDASANGYTSVNFKIDSSSSYLINVFLSINHDYPFFKLNGGETYIYKIYSLTENLIDMQPQQMPGIRLDYKRVF